MLNFLLGVVGEVFFDELYGAACDHLGRDEADKKASKAFKGDEPFLSDKVANV